MKKILGLAVAMVFAFALTANAEEVVKVKEQTKGDTTKVEVKAKDKAAGTKEDVKVVETADKTTVKAKETDKAAGTKEKLTVKEEGSTVAGKDVVKHKHGDVAKETVKFEKYEAKGDYIYVVKDNKLVRMNHKLSDNMKQDMLKLKKGDTVTITSTYQMTPEEVATITGIERAK